MNLLLLTSALLLLNSVASAAPIRLLCPGVPPLPHEQVGPLFEQLRSGDKIEAKVLVKALNGPQLTLRAYAATAMADCGLEAVPYLIDALSDQSVHVGANYFDAGMATTRHRANEALKKLTKKDFGFAWNAPDSDREQAIGRWIRWFKEYVAVEKSGGRDADKLCKLT